MVYHIRGCMNCRDCRQGYQISCQTKVHRGGASSQLCCCLYVPALSSSQPASLTSLKSAAAAVCWHITLHLCSMSSSAQCESTPNLLALQQLLSLQNAPLHGWQLVGEHAAFLLAVGPTCVLPHKTPFDTKGAGEVPLPQPACLAGHGWQLDGGHAAFMLAEEVTCILLPQELSYVDGALVACGFGTAWEALTRMSVSGKDHLLVRLPCSLLRRCV